MAEIMENTEPVTGQNTGETPEQNTETITETEKKVEKTDTEKNTSDTSGSSDKSETSDNLLIYPVPETKETASETTVSTSVSESASTIAEETKDNASTADTDSKNSTHSHSNNTSNTSGTDTSNITGEDSDEEEYDEQTSSDTTKNTHAFRDFFSNFRSKRKMELHRDEMILSRISDDDLMEYLRLEQKRLEILQQAKDVREKRIWIAFQITVTLLSVVLIVYFLKDNPVILVTILYTIGILAALRIAKRPSDSGKNKSSSDGTSKKLWE